MYSYLKTVALQEEEEERCPPLKLLHDVRRRRTLGLGRTGDPLTEGVKKGSMHLYHEASMIPLEWA